MPIRPSQDLFDALVQRDESEVRPAESKDASVIEDTWRTFLQSPTFYGFGTASVPPFPWGLHRKDREGDAATAELVFRRMLQEWEIPPDVVTHFIGAADDAFRRVQEVIPLAMLNGLEKPGYMRETMIPGVRLRTKEPRCASGMHLLRS